MAKRRSAGEGGITQRKDGRWVAELDIGKVDGKRKKRYFYGKTKKESADKLRAAQQNKQSISLSHKLTVEEFLNDWLNNMVKPYRRYATYRSYEPIVRLRLIPHLGALRLIELDARHVQQMINVIKPTLQPRTVRNVRAVLRKALNVAVKRGTLTRNAAVPVEIPEIKRFTIQPLDVEQARRLLLVVQGHRLETLYRVALSLGLRRGEVLGLRWEDVNLSAGTLAITGTLARVKAQGLVRSAPKTESGYRTLPLPPVLRDVLIAHQQRQNEERSLAADKWQHTGYVFTTQHGTPIEPRVLITQFKRFLKKAGLSTAIRFHDLRHSCATLLIAQNVNPRVVMEMLGHAQISTTMNIYAHVDAVTLHAAAAGLDSLLSEPPTVLELPAKKVKIEGK